MATDLAAIERACECVLGGAGTPQERAQAQARVLALGTDIANITLIQALLDSSSNNYAIVVAAQSLLRLVTGAWRGVPRRVAAAAGGAAAAWPTAAPAGTPFRAPRAAFD